MGVEDEMNKPSVMLGPPTSRPPRLGAAVPVKVPFEKRTSCAQFIHVQPERFVFTCTFVWVGLMLRLS